MAGIVQEEAPPVPNWLLKLEEQRAKRLKAKLGHEAGAGAPCTICGAKCPGLDLHFWRKICKICKCGKEDHDISDEDIYGFVQFTLLGSKPIKAKGILLKGSNNEVILEFTPKGSSNDVEKYLDELPDDLLPVKGSEAAKLRKQRLQKQMPAHDIDPSLCHALTDEEIKQLEEYVAFIRKHSVGQGSIIRLPLFKGTQHNLNKTNAKLISQTIPNQQIASNQAVFLQSSDLANNLQNLSLKNPEKIPPNYPPTGVEIHPLTTLNVERHQEQYEDPNFEINNANLSYNPAPNVAYIPSFVSPTEEHQIPVTLGLTKDLNYPVNYTNIPSNKQNLDGEQPPPINEKTHPNFNDQNCNVGAASRIQTLQPNQLIDPINDRQVPCFGGYITDLNYPTNTTNIPKPQMPILKAQNLINPLETHQNLTSVGLLQDLNYPMMNLEDGNSNIQTARCHECAENFPEGSVAVSAERTTNLWHPKCFNCHTCKQPLADLLYFYHKETDNIYCGRDYAILRGIPRCAACDELIFVREYCLAEGSTFHVKHFCCFECDQPLAGKSYLMENNRPLCLDCFENLKAENCRDCNKVIRPEEQGVCLQDLHWHDCCFVCKKCRKPLLGQKMLLRNEHLFCSDFCYKNY